MSDTHAARPTDLVALVTFDGEVRENQAVTRERLGRAPEPSHPLNAALEQWLGLGRQTWLTVQGREVQGIATARELSAKTAWEVDTLIDAEYPSADREVLRDLLRQAAVAAEHAHATHVLLRTAADSAAADQAIRAGFTPALHERLWTGQGLDAADADAAPADAVTVRPVLERDSFALFQLYSRTLPIEARQALAMTFEEWAALRERRWCAHGETLVAVEEDRIVGSLRIGENDERTQFELTLAADAACEPAGDALLSAARTRLGDRPVLTLVPTTAGSAERLLRRRGLSPGAAYVLLCRRIARPIREAARVRAGAVIPTRG